MPCTFANERECWSRGLSLVAGIDEAGRGPLAGPVVAAAVILPQDFEAGALDDSKKLSPRTREKIYSLLVSTRGVVFSVAVIDAGEIDRLNILRATHEAMRRALDGLGTRADHALVDGLPVPGLSAPHTAIVGGDGISLSIAAASILAKVTRDRLMLEADGQFPGYGFAQHKGYGTKGHLDRLHALGPCPIHRRSFSPVARAATAHR